MREPDLIPQKLVDEILADRKRYGTPGLGIAIVAGPSEVTGRTEWEEQIIVDGIAKGDGTPFAKDTIFTMASISKPFSYICVGMLIDRKTVVPSTGKPITWNTKIKDVLGDGWKLQDPIATEEATLQDAGGMRVGISPHVYAMSTEPARDFLYRLRHLRQGRKFRERFEYESECPVAMSLIVATLSGMSYPEFIMENLFKPLGLHSTANGTRDLRKTGRLCEGHFRTGINPDVPGPEGWGKPRNIGWCMGDNDGEWAQGHHGLVTCLEDTTKLLREFMDPIVLPENWLKHRHRPISIFTPGEFPPHYFSWSPGVESAGYAYGHYQIAHRGYEVLMTAGLESGTRGFLAYVPKAKIGIWITANEDGPGGRIIEESTPKILDSLLGLEPLPRPPSPTYFVEPAFPPKVRLPVGTGYATRRLDTESSERILLTSRGFYDPGHFNLTFETYDIFEKTPLNEAIKDAARASPARAALRNLLEPSKDRKYYIATPNFNFISKMLVITTDTPGLYEWHGIRYRPLLDSQTGELGSKPLPAPGKLVLTEKGLGMFGGFMDRTSLTARPIPEGWQEDWRKVESGCEAWFEKV